MYQFIHADTKELLSTMMDGTYAQARSERDRLSEECECAVIIVEG